MSDTRALASLQRELGRWIAALEGLPDGAELEARVRADRGVDAARRIDVYANAYFARLHDVLRDDYPALAAALGDAAFHDLAKLYLLAHPPRSFTLRFLGARLPAFLASPAAEWFRERWPFAPELAAFEWAIADVFDAADRPVLARETLAAVPAEAWAELRFELAAALRILTLDWPVERLRAAHDNGEPLPALASEPTALLVWRRDERVRWRALPSAEADAFTALAAGEDFASVCAHVDSAQDALAFLERWLADGLLSALAR
jgi:hypothetical protein